MLRKLSMMNFVKFIVCMIVVMGNTEKWPTVKQGNAPIESQSFGLTRGFSSNRLLTKIRTTEMYEAYMVGVYFTNRSVGVQPWIEPIALNPNLPLALFHDELAATNWANANVPQQMKWMLYPVRVQLASTDAFWGKQK